MESAVPSLYPLLFEPSLHEKVWGGRQLGTRLGKILPSAQPFGEAWEIFWKNRVANGAFRDKTLGELIAAYPEEIAGKEDANPEFPLLIKFLDANDWLSVQVHPNDSQAAELEGEPRGKTECWYIIDAAPGAQLVYGFAEQIDQQTFREAIKTGRIKDVMQYVNVSAGDFIFVPAGMMHALGPGILLYELQQTSDTTYRVYDWDRMGLDGKPRELHVEKSLKVTNYAVKPEARKAYTPNEPQTRIFSGQYFALDRIRLHGKPAYTVTQQGAHCLSVIGGSATLSSPGGTFEPVALPLGQSVFMPAQLGAYLLETDGTVEILKAYEHHG